MAYYVKMVIRSFYPMTLNTAKRVKLTVEALETKGLSRGARSKKVMTLKFSYMKIGAQEFVIFGAFSLALVAVIILGKAIPFPY